MVEKNAAMTNSYLQKNTENVKLQTEKVYKLYIIPREQFGYSSMINMSLCVI